MDKRRFSSRRMCLVLGLLGCILDANSADWYVALSGAGAPGTSWATAFTNVQDAVSAAANNDSIHIKQGCYVLADQIVISNKVLNIIGGYVGSGTPGPRTNDASLTVLDATNGTYRCALIANCSTGLIEGLTFARGRPSSADGGGLYFSSTTNALRNCVIRDCGIANTRFGLGICVNAGRLFMERCLLTDNYAFSLGAYGGVFVFSAGIVHMNACVVAGNYSGNCWGPAVYATGAGTRADLHNCLIRNNYGNAGGAALVAWNNAVLTVSNCTVCGNAPAGVLDNAFTRIHNSILWNNVVDFMGLHQGTTIYSCVEDTWITGTGVIHANPCFEFGWFLASNSPCIDAGGDASSSVGLSGLYAQASVQDSGTVDLGYHSQTGYAPSIPDLYVGTNGNDANSGTLPHQPLRTISNALAKAVVGTRIHLGGGDYTNVPEGYPLDVKKDALVLCAAEPGAAVIDASGSGARAMVVSNCSGVVLSNLVIRGGNNGSGLGGGVLLIKANARAHGCIFKDNGSKAPYCYPYGGGVAVLGGAAEFDGCSFRNNYLDGIGSTSGGGGLDVKYGSSTLRNCVFFGNIATYSGAGVCAERSDMRFRNCLVVSNIGASSVYALLDASTTASVENCTFVGNVPSGIHTPGPAFVINTILWNNGDDVTGSVSLAYSNVEDGDNAGTNGCICADPRFRNMAAGDYQLGNGSPCRDAGSNLPWMATATDIAGNPRICSQPVDMGAFESPANGSMFFGR